jgi:hypothetical protein
VRPRAEPAGTRDGRSGASKTVRPRAEPAGTRWEKWGRGGASLAVRPRAEPAGTRDGREMKSEGAGARTQDLRIKSPLLYRLSYALNLRLFRLPHNVLANH